jgi:hypothetical protein
MESARRRGNTVSTPKKNEIPADNLNLYEKLIQTIPEIERKGAANPYTSVNGHMVTYLDPSGSPSLRLPKDELEKFLKKYKTTLFVAYGVVKKEYAAVPDSLLRNTNELRKYLELSYEYTKTLKPKPSRNKS